VVIRHADPERDAAACAAIYAPFVTATAVSFEEEAPDPEEVSRRIARISTRYPWLVAEVDGAVAGYAYGCPHRERAAYRWTAEVTIYLDSEYRNRGIGKALYTALLELLARQGIRTACGGVTLPNPASVALHESCGFEPVGIYRKVGFKLGAWHDVGWWQLELASGGEQPPPEPSPPLRLDA
jgi:phosphinothricin acetyltransferase